MFTEHIRRPSLSEVKSASIVAIPHDQQRYPTAGDWIFDEKTGALRIFVSKTEDWRECMAVGVHELVEALCCLQDGVEPDLVDAFDIDYEEYRKEGDVSEPGDDPIAPYYAQHQTATNVEHIVTTALGLHWDTYNDHLGQLDEKTERGLEPAPPHTR